MAEKVLMKGNEALAEAAIQAGCRHFFGYPITPQTEISAYLSKRMPKVVIVKALCSLSSCFFSFSCAFSSIVYKFFSFVVSF